MSQTKLLAIIYAQPFARRFSGDLLSTALGLPDRLPASRELADGEVQEKFVSLHLRPADVPLAFHRAASTPTYGVMPGAASGVSLNQGMRELLEAQGRELQYLFSDGLILAGNQVFYHPHSKVVPRHFLPLTLNIRTELREKPRIGRVPHWQHEGELAIMSVLLNAGRSLKLAAQATGDSNDRPEAPDLFFVHDETTHVARTALKLNGVELEGEGWGPWHVTTALPEPVGGVHYGRARIELDPRELDDLQGLSVKFILHPNRRVLGFHSYEEQLHRLRSRTPGVATDTGLSLHLSGHAFIQSTLQEIDEMWREEGRKLSLFPGSKSVPADKVKPKLSLLGDGSFRFTARIVSGDDVWELHGIPQGLSYLLMNLQHGLGATTGYANAQIAHARRGLKRERDIKVLKSLGFASLVFYDAANFALGNVLSDGTNAQTEQEVCESLFTRMGSMILKSEGWPVQTGTIADLCSKNVTTLIEGFVSQVVSDFKGRDIALYLPEGELRVAGLSRAVAQLFHSMVKDLAASTGGTCFLKARTKFFDDFLNGRTPSERDDVALRREVEAETAARMVYQPGINERYKMPASSAPPKGANVLGLLHEGFDLSIDGKEVEEFEAHEFRPEFTLHEEDAVGNEIVTTGNVKLDWFELHPKFFFKGTEITGEQAARLSKDGMLEFQGKLYRVRAQDMPSLGRLTRFWSQIQAHSAGLIKKSRRKTEETYYQLPRSQTLELLALRASGVSVRGGPRWDEITKFYDSLDKERPPLQLPETFTASLQPYQTVGVQWITDLQELGLGGILADDMGLGKTVTSLAFLESLRSKGKMGSVLILVPTSLTYNWLAEATRFAPGMPIQIFSSREPESMLDFVQKNEASAVVCTYGLLQEHAEVFQQVRWGTIIFDEAQNLKNITTKRTTAARKLSAGFKLCLTGTPLENHYGELYSLFDLIVPGALGDLASFRERFVNPVRVLREEIDFLRLKTKPLLLRRTKSQVMHELPPKVETTVKLPFEEQQKRIYRDIATSYNEQVRSAIAKQGEAKSQLQMLTALLRLRQVCSDPSSIPGINYTGEPPKISTLVEALQEVTESGASALVFTQFLATFERIRWALTQAKIDHYDISGADSRINREKKLRAFQDAPGGAVMLMTLKTGGVGLNLVKASYIFHIEPWWNPAVENQATDRAHRIGQTRTVQVYRYLIKDSVEEKIEILKDIKSKRFDALFTLSEREGELSPEAGSSALTQRDFEYLLG